MAAVTEAWSAPLTTVSISLAQYTIATSAGVTIASGGLTVAGEIDTEYVGATNIASGAAEQVVTFTNAQSDNTYYITLSPEFNATSEGGLWIVGKSTTSFTLSVGSGVVGSGSVVDWHVFR